MMNDSKKNVLNVAVVVVAAKICVPSSFCGSPLCLLVSVLLTSLCAELDIVKKSFTGIRGENHLSCRWKTVDLCKWPLNCLSAQLPCLVAPDTSEYLFWVCQNTVSQHTYLYPISCGNPSMQCLFLTPQVQKVSVASSHIVFLRWYKEQRCTNPAHAQETRTASFPYGKPADYTFYCSEIEKKYINVTFLNVEWFIIHVWHTSTIYYSCLSIEGTSVFVSSLAEVVGLGL